MKRASSLFFALLLIVSLISAGEAKPLTIKGTIIDLECATSHRKSLKEFVKTHTKECALMPGCAASGYGIFAEGKFQKFDKESNAKIVDFLKKKDSKTHVEAAAEKTAKGLKLVTIKNQGK